MIKIKIPRSVWEWLYYQCFPDMKEMATAHSTLFPKTEIEYWTSKITEYVFRSVVKKFSKKESTASQTVTIVLEIAEGYCFYRFLHVFPIYENERWKVFQRQRIVDDLLNQLTTIRTVY